MKNKVKIASLLLAIAGLSGCEINDRKRLGRLGTTNRIRLLGAERCRERR